MIQLKLVIQLKLILANHLSESKPYAGKGNTFEIDTDKTPDESKPYPGKGNIVEIDIDDNLICYINNYKDFIFNPEKMKKLRVQGHACHLSGADFRSANLRGADLRGVNFRYTDLKGADLRGASLQNADLEGANLALADLRGANLSGANTENTFFEGAKYNDATDLPGFDLIFYPERRGMVNLDKETLIIPTPRPRPTPTTPTTPTTPEAQKNQPNKNIK